MIRYKVVRKEDRSSCSLTKGEEEYIKYYKKGKTVKAKRGTLGIFVFKTEKQASRFIFQNFSSFNLYTILKVETVGRGKSPKYICGNPVFLLYYQSRILNNFYKNGEYKLCPPEGTICYPAVKVLE